MTLKHYEQDNLWFMRDSKHTKGTSAIWSAYWRNTTNKTDNIMQSNVGVYVSIRLV